MWFLGISSNFASAVEIKLLAVPRLAALTVCCLLRAFGLSWHSLQRASFSVLETITVIIRTVSIFLDAAGECGDLASCSSAWDARRAVILAAGGRASCCLHLSSCGEAKPQEECCTQWECDPKESLLETTFGVLFLSSQKGGLPTVAGASLKLCYAWAHLGSSENPDAQVVPQTN